MNASAIPGFLMVTLVSDPTEWNRMWAALAAFWKGDTADYNPAFGECWQYMGTTLRADSWEHVFRHRMHPRSKRREHHRVLASSDFHRSHPPSTKPPKPYAPAIPPFDPAHCGGAFDGITVTSDADSGL